MAEVRRETIFTSEPEELWRAISDEEMLERWLGDEVELEPFEGGDVRVVTGGEERTGRVEELDQGSRIVFTWARPGERDSRVELTVLPDAIGSRLVVVERLGTGTEPMASAALWTSRLTALHEALALVLV
jgi:uncharacterized protein YndB with AHSA1/START domain